MNGTPMQAISHIVLPPAQTARSAAAIRRGISSPGSGRTRQFGSRAARAAMASACGLLPPTTTTISVSAGSAGPIQAMTSAVTFSGSAAPRVTRSWRAEAGNVRGGPCRLRNSRRSSAYSVPSSRRV